MKTGTVYILSISRLLDLGFLSMVKGPHQNIFSTSDFWSRFPDPAISDRAPWVDLESCWCCWRWQWWWCRVSVGQAMMGGSLGAASLHWNAALPAHGRKLQTWCPTCRCWRPSGTDGIWNYLTPTPRVREKQTRMSEVALKSIGFWRSNDQHGQI